MQDLGSKIRLTITPVKIHRPIEKGCGFFMSQKDIAPKAPGPFNIDKT